MDLGLIIMLIIGFGSLIFAFIGEGGHVIALVSWTAAVIVFGGTAGAIGVAFPMSLLKNIGKILKVGIAKKHYDLKATILLFKELSVKTRKNGLLSLEAELNDESMEPFIKKGLQMVVDGLEPAMIRGILEVRLDNMSARHKEGAEIFETAGAFLPTLGIVGTVMGLVHVLGNLSDPSSLGPKIAAGFIATLYGVGSANLIFLPFANRLKSLNKEEMLEKEMMIEAILLIQEGANPNTIVSKLEGFLTQSEIEQLAKEEGN